jgi:hypothetical protein
MFSGFNWLLQKIYQRIFKVSISFDLVDSKGSSLCVGCPMRGEFSRDKEEVNDDTSIYLIE